MHACPETSRRYSFGYTWAATAVSCGTWAQKSRLHRLHLTLSPCFQTPVVELYLRLELQLFTPLAHLHNFSTCASPRSSPGYNISVFSCLRCFCTVILHLEPQVQHKKPARSHTTCGNSIDSTCACRWLPSRPSVDGRDPLDCSTWLFRFDDRSELWLQAVTLLIGRPGGIEIIIITDDDLYS